MLTTGGLQLGNSYTGLKHRTPTGKTVFEEYHAFFDELSYFAQVVYGYSDCSERFQMDPTLDEEARRDCKELWINSILSERFLGDHQALLPGNGIGWSRLKLLAPLRLR